MLSVYADSKGRTMPAQRGSHIKWNGNYSFGNECLIAFPEHGALVAATIAGWAATEAHLGRVFGSLIGAKQPVTMSMYAAVRSFEVQRDIIVAACKELLPIRYAQMAAACMNVIQKASQTRHRFAHCVWGASADPQLIALLLVDPKIFWRLHVDQKRYHNNKRGSGSIERVGPVQFVANMKYLDLDDVWVYTLKDLQEARTSVDRA